MTAYRARLTETDIRRLIKATDDDDRAAAAHKLCRSMERAELTGEEREAARKILRMLAHDAADERGGHRRRCRRPQRGDGGLATGCHGHGA